MNVSCPDCRSIFRVDPAKVPASGVRARCSVCGGVISIPAPTGANTPASGSPRTSNPSSESTAQARSRSTAPAQDSWDPTPFSAAQRAPAESMGHVSAATATPPSPTSGLPEFSPPPAVPPFNPPAPHASPFGGPTAPPFVPGGARAATPARTQSPPPAPLRTPASSASPPPPPPPPPRAPSASSGTAEAGARRPLNPFLSKDPNQRAKRLARALVSDIITYHPAKHAEGLRDGTLKQLFREEIKKSFEEYIAQVGQQLAEGTTYFQEALNEVLGAGKKIF